MYRNATDFVQDWKNSSKGTLDVFQSITDEKLSQSIVEGHSSLGWLAWHLTTAAAMFGGLAGLQIDGVSADDQAPDTIKEIMDSYKKVAVSIEKNAIENFKDEDMLTEVDGLGGKVPRGQLLRILIDHQTHHRGQMTVLLRQAGLGVPPIMGPTQEMK
ncbi:putative damage-inducible protein DinB [Gracilibacillus halotolerans]|uniref:Putative damage-inducible protein DinB n=1 Tax=Gracilibacillus halotolerans TaxID=74386 RepID=A0A841RNI8_9BACI|nr:DinB family protein [Gracilibacillus halotolerans]MBB6513437.1 putative damage-inducible protein DinB [Gracilibacillus halotolerans]